VSRHSAGSLVIAGCALSWGAIGIIVRELDMPAMTIVFFRVALSAAAVAAGLALAGRRDLLRLKTPAVLALGLLLALHWSLYFGAIKETSVASAVLITYAGPIFMAILAPLLIREHVPRVSVAALAVSVAGIALITLSGGSGEGEVRPLGVALAVLAAASFGLLIVLLKKYAAEVDPLTVVLYESLTAALVLLPAAAFADYELGGSEVPYLLVLGLLLTAATGVLYVGALRWVPATTAGILSYMEPVSAALLAAIVLDEALTPGIAVGGAAIVAAGVAVVLRTREPLAASPEEPVAPAAASRAGAR
jgi:drug/metabolite transporter (DMT)-like permease